MNPVVYLNLAAEVAKPGSDLRTYAHGAVGLRRDGAIVTSRNGSAVLPCPEIHAERRLLRKLDRNGTVFVARVGANGSWQNSRPCPACRSAMRARGVARVFFTLGANAYGCEQFG